VAILEAPSRRKVEVTTSPRSPQTPQWLQYLRLTRTYTWVDAISTGLLGYFVMRPTGEAWKGLTVAVLSSLVLWFGLNWISEFRQRDVGRIRVPFWMAALPLVAALGFVSARNLIAIVPLVAYWLVSIVYAQKRAAPAIADVCFVIRGIQTALHFIFVAMLFGPFQLSLLPLAGGLLLIQSSRSLVAEVRDEPFDEFGLPKLMQRVFGERSSKVTLAVAAALGQAGGAVLGYVPLGIGVAFTLISVAIVRRYRVSTAIASFHIHRNFISVMVLIKCLSGPPAAHLLMAFTMTVVSYIIAGFEYSKVYRPINALAST